MKRFRMLAGLLVIASLGLSGCALFLVGAGAAGGYAISKDSVINHYDLPEDVVFRQSLAVAKEKGQVVLEDAHHGLIKAQVGDVKVTITITPITKHTVKLRVRARNAMLMPALDVAQDVYNAIHQRL